MTRERVYLDHNATMPLRCEAKAAMINAMDVIGNPSSIHKEGRAAKHLIEKARQQVAEACGALNADIVFTSGATESAALALQGRRLHSGDIEHDAIAAWTLNDLSVSALGHVEVHDPSRTVLQAANSETGVVQDLPVGLALVDFTQAIGRKPVAFDWSGAELGILSAHKFGGPKGIGALLVKRDVDLAQILRGGGQEMGRRSGTENILGIIGMGAAIEVASQDLERGVWDQIAQFRNILEFALGTIAKETIFVAQDSERLGNTSCFAVPGWKGETQVMQMDLAGFAVSAGSACSSGKVKASRVLRAMGFNEQTAASAIRVSLGRDTTKDHVERFAEAWGACYHKFKNRAA